MPSDLWSFTFNLYTQPGVEQACLRLQASGANVCTLICGAWLGQRGVICSVERLSEIRQLATPWHDAVVQPLRALRTQWRMAAADDAEWGALRQQVKGLELDAERTLLARLEILTQGWPVGVAEDLVAWLEGLAADAAKENRDALRVLRVAVDQR
ncbi:TIGR02444 family protein [Pseudomonas sp. MH10]|uniref:TIGR02444 family protein n=2 Tax=Pseudomonas sp. MH10 TaxID=3048627 RepID=UPI002AC8C39A|nr:TIGR02444 family protein [Pseudomonas sp. MH10]WPX66553.1 TIGR02444 family protein [Pseudomonas sp. MH10]